MQKKAGKAGYGLRWGVFSLITAFAVMSVCTDPAEARAKRKRSGKAAASAPYVPPYSDIVVDVNSGAVLRATNADAPRHPASLTKIMTLYLLFEQLEAGKLSLNSQLPVTAHAAAAAPSKLGLKPGSTIAVEDAIKATVTKSANDVAVVIAEAVGGDEQSFGTMMTAKARALGMQNTVYKNASGLPNDAQITTARDQALLGRAIQDRFPKYYAYFSTTRFSFRGAIIAGHNRLLGKVEGVDGIKTGYTDASGYNLVTSLRRSGRHVVGVVLGGRSASSRDDKMRSLVSETIQVAAAKRTAPLLAEASAPLKKSVVQRIAAAVVTPARAEIAPAAPAPMPPTVSVVAAPAPMPAAPAVVAAPLDATPPSVRPGSEAPLAPIAVRTVAVKPGAQSQSVAFGTAALAPASTASVPAKGPQLAFAEPVNDGSHRQPGVLGVLNMKVASATPAPVVSHPVSAAVEPPPELLRPSAVRSGWMIQIGAFDKEDEARTRLSTALTRAKSVLGSANGFTERVAKGDKTLYRARFTGLEKDQAEAACQYLKKNDIACMALKN